MLWILMGSRNLIAMQGVIYCKQDKATNRAINGGVRSSHPSSTFKGILDGYHTFEDGKLSGPEVVRFEIQSIKVPGSGGKQSQSDTYTHQNHNHTRYLLLLYSLLLGYVATGLRCKDRPLIGNAVLDANFACTLKYGPQHVGHLNIPKA